MNRLLAAARFSVVPSEWYENNPFSVIESHCAGTPVVGANIGGIPELIDDTDGITFMSRDAESLEGAIKEAWNMTWDYENISRKALARFSPEQHYIALHKIYGTGSAL